MQVLLSLTETVLTWPEIRYRTQTQLGVMASTPDLALHMFISSEAEVSVCVASWLLAARAPLVTEWRLPRVLSWQLSDACRATEGEHAEISVQTLANHIRYLCNIIYLFLNAMFFYSVRSSAVLSQDEDLWSISSMVYGPMFEIRKKYFCLF